MLRLAGALDLFWFLRWHHGEGRGWMERALALAGDDAPANLRAKALGGAGRLAIHQGEGNRQRAEALIAQSLALWRTLGDKKQVAVSLIRLGLAYIDQERYDEAAARTQEAFALFEELRDMTVTAAPGASIALTNLGDIAYAQGEYARAAAYYAEALARQRAMGFTWAAGTTLAGLGNLARVQGDIVEGAARYRESLDHWRSHGDPQAGIDALAGLANVALAWGQPERAARLLAAVAAFMEVAGGSFFPSDRADQERTLAAARAALSVDGFTAAWAEGWVLSFEAAVAEALQVGSAPPEPTGIGSPEEGTAPSLLTPRELEVLRLVAEGRSDQEIAKALSLTYRTVTTYVGNVLNKLGVDSRTAAAAWAIRRGLV
jgi:DNA-binding CsgD family transcriptional regulator